MEGGGGTILKARMTILLPTFIFLPDDVDDEEGSDICCGPNSPSPLAQGKLSTSEESTQASHDAHTHNALTTSSPNLSATSFTSDHILIHPCTIYTFSSDYTYYIFDYIIPTPRTQCFDYIIYSRVLRSKHSLTS